MKKIITLLLILCMSFTVVACGSSDTSVDGTSESNSSVEETATEESVDEKEEIIGDTEAAPEESNLDEQTVNDDRYRVGDIIDFTSETSAFSMKILATDVYDEVGVTFLHIEVEIENTGNDTISFHNTDMTFYGDDYAIEDQYRYPVDPRIITSEVAPGRKVRGGFYINCNDYDSYSVIEGQFADAVIVIKDENTPLNVVTSVDTGNTSEGNLAGMGYTGDFINSTGDTMLYLTEFDVPDPNGALGNVWIYQGENLLVDTPYYLDTNGSSDSGYERLYYFGDDRGDMYFLGVRSVGEGVVVDYNSVDTNIDCFSICTE